MSEKVMGHDAAQEVTVPRLQKRVDYYKGLGDKGDKRDRAGSSDSSGEVNSRIESKRKCKRET